MAMRIFAAFERVAPIGQNIAKRRANPVVVGKRPLVALGSGPFSSATYKAKTGSPRVFRAKTGSKLVAGWGRKAFLLPPLIVLVVAMPAEAKVSCPERDLTAKDHWAWAKKLKHRHHLPKWARDRHRHWLVCAAGTDHRKVMKKRWRRMKRTILPKRHDLWIRIGRCEQPGRGYKGVNWSHAGPTYQGGLGFWYGTWSGFKYPGMPSNAGYATWRQQMKVANRLYRLYGTSPWGCA